MIKRIVDISEQAYIHLKHQQLLIDKDQETIAQIPIEDLGVLILQHSAIVITQRVIIACQQNNVVIVFCDDKHLPYSTILPIGEGNKLHQKILQQQINITEPVKKRLWQQIIKIKITNQAEVLQYFNKNNNYLLKQAKSVKSGDKNNTEAIVAQYYWKLLMGKDFVRDTNQKGVNALLNYGYSIIRAMIARAICGAGLHPALGLFHHNQYNSLCLADDLMEPFRPWVDKLVYEYRQDNKQISINQTSKRILLDLLSNPVKFKDKNMPLMIASHLLIADLKRCYIKEKIKLTYPVIAYK